MINNVQCTAQVFLLSVTNTNNIKKYRMDIHEVGDNVWRSKSAKIKNK